MSRVLHQDADITALDVRCTCPAGSVEEEELDQFEVVVPLSGALHRRARSAAGAVDAAFGYVGRPGEGQTMTHWSDGDRCVAIIPSSGLASDIGLDDPRLAIAPVTRARQRDLVAALISSPHTDPLAGSERWIEVLLGVRPQRPATPGGRAAARQRRAAVARVQEAIRADPGSPRTVPSLASTVGYAPHHLSRVFRSVTGMTLSDYRDRIRIGRAVALVRDGCPIADVAAILGFWDHAHLTRRVSELLGVPPSSLRQH